ncbi:MAG TPA: efflux RND transporter periplasmic adaptor subunit [Chlamydiales bacterium]|nr:efflux RND transporter periplasmic adaptor subunit [Chlamydiales bacterium]
MKKLCAGLILLSLMISCNKKPEKTPPPSYPVKVTKAISKDVPLYIPAFGHVESIDSVKINTRVEGELMNVHFKEGQEVKEGDLLFTIDPRPYAAELAQQEALLMENMADLKIAQDKLQRNRSLIEKDYISQLDYEEMEANVSKLEAVIEQNLSAIANAKLNLEYCEILAPIDGKTGILTITKGNMIYPSSSETLITIQKLDPIYITFSVPEKRLPDIQKYSQIATLDVEVSYEFEKMKSYMGKLEIINNLVNVDTGMIKLRGVFQNESKELWPGKFIYTKLILTTLKDAVLIPSQCIQITQAGKFVFVLKEDQTVEMRKVETGQRQDEFIVIEKGLKKDETVVTEGQLNLYPDAHVFISSENSGKEAS